MNDYRGIVEVVPVEQLVELAPVEVLEMIPLCELVVVPVAPGVVLVDVLGV